MTDVEPQGAPAQGTGGRESGTPEVMELLYGQAPADGVSARVCMRADCGHPAADHDSGAPSNYRPCITPGCPCHQLLEES